MPQLRPALDGVGAPTGPPSPRAALFWDGTYWRMAAVDAGGRLQVRGEDQLFSIKEVLTARRTAVISGAGGYVDSDSPPDGVYWVVTAGSAFDSTSPTTMHTHVLEHAPFGGNIHVERLAFAAPEASCWRGKIVMAHDDMLRVWFAGALAGDSCTVSLAGYVMTVE